MATALETPARRSREARRLRTPRMAELTGAGIASNTAGARSGQRCVGSLSSNSFFSPNTCAGADDPRASTPEHLGEKNLRGLPEPRVPKESIVRTTSVPGQCTCPARSDRASPETVRQRGAVRICSGRISAFTPMRRWPAIAVSRKTSAMTASRGREGTTKKTRTPCASEKNCRQVSVATSD